MSSAESTPPPIRIGHQEREDSVRALAEHYAQGRLTGEEYEERIALAWDAQVASQLQELFTDLPEPRPVWSPGGGEQVTTQLPGPPGWSGPQPPPVAHLSLIHI